MGWLARHVRSRGGWRAVRPKGGMAGGVGKELYAAPLRLSRTTLARADATDRPSRPLPAVSCLRSPTPSRRLSILASARENSNLSSSVPLFRSHRKNEASLAVAAPRLTSESLHA
jgi:hypothetical protein